MRLTGRFRFRRTFTGKIVLQVEEEVKSSWPTISRTRAYTRRWRTATAMDLASTELRLLMDLQLRSPLPGLDLAVAQPTTPPAESPPNVISMTAR